jgi:formylglycine-generating enzyme required for sulfatase activity
MHGNVREWCEDPWHDNYMGKTKELTLTAAPWTEGGRDSRILRGGSWDFDHPHMRSANRQRGPVTNRYNGTGFRVARDIDVLEKVE